VRAYNVATNTWAYKHDMPDARWGMNGAGVIGGKIYVTGGYTKDGYRGVTASLFVYSIASNTWTQKRNMPAAGGDGVTGVIGGKLYVVTFNYFYRNPEVNFFRYSPTTDSWTKLPSPTDYPSLNVGGGVINNKLYLMGQGGNESNRVLEYDPITNQWTKKRSWSSQSCVPNFACFLEGPTVVMLSHLYVFGREWYGFGASPGIFIYDPVSNTWARKPLLTTFSYWDVARLTAARVFLNGQPRVEVIGGYRPGNNQQYIP
jgi:N-acetylneuraminic acid mutarotase